MLIAIFLGSLGSYGGMKWYHNRAQLKLPTNTPPDFIFGPVWSTIFALTTLFTLLFWNKYDHHTISFWLIIILVILNMILNTFWSYLFFSRHLIKAALIDAIFLTLTVYAIMGICSYYYSFLLSLLLLPYALWGTFACYLNYQIYQLNHR